MTTINLRSYYPWYKHDEYIEVPDEVAAELKVDKLYEVSYQRQLITGQENEQQPSKKMPHRGDYPCGVRRDKLSRCFYKEVSHGRSKTLSHIIY